MKRCKFCGHTARTMLDIHGEHACHDRPACQRRTQLIGRWIGTRVLRRQDIDGTQWTIRRHTHPAHRAGITSSRPLFILIAAAKAHVEDVIASLTAGTFRAYAEARP